MGNISVQCQSQTDTDGESARSIPILSMSGLDLATIVGRNIKRGREQAGLSKRALARLAQSSPAHIIAIERGDRAPSLPTLALIARALRLHPADLLRGAPLPRLRSTPEVKLPQHVEAIARDLAALPTAERGKALRAIRALLRFGGRGRSRR